MVAKKMTAKNQLSLPKGITDAVDPRSISASKLGQIILTPVRIQRADAVRAKLAELDLQEQDSVDAVAWTRQRSRKARI